MDRAIVQSLIEDVATSLISQVDSAIPAPTAEKWVAERLRDLWSRYKSRTLRSVYQAYIPAPMSVGTVSVTYDSPFVTPDGAALAAWQSYSVGGGPGIPAQVVGPQGFEGWFFRLFSGRVWYRVIAIDPNSGQMTLENPFSQDTTGSTSGVTVTGNAYYLLPRYIDLDPRVRFIGTVVMDSWFRELDVVSLDIMDRRWPARWLVAFPPWCCAEVGTNLEAVGQPKRLEFYPYPQVSTTVHYVGYQHPPLLQASDPIPPTIDPELLLQGTLEKAYRWMSFQCGNPKSKLFNVESAALFLNMANQQATRWEQMWPRAARNDRGVDDLTMILKTGRWNRGPMDYDPVRSARDQWFAGGPFTI